LVGEPLDAKVSGSEPSLTANSSRARTAALTPSVSPGVHRREPMCEPPPVPRSVLHQSLRASINHRAHRRWSQTPLDELGSPS